ncbi:MAG: hypothetical protein LIQ30_01495 [Planctomycetes bacterium]|nr:hypothetical protein [Planctomycetota bacterium]MCD7895542.1 hypothetical protein [Planctomycetaceae bacterium]
MGAKFRAMLPILFLTFGHGAVDSYVGLLQAVTPGAAEFLDIPIGDLVMLVGLGAMVNNLIQPLVGAIMGKRNIAWALWLAVVVSSLPCLMGWVSSYWAVATLIFLGALGTGVYHPEAVLAASDAAGTRAYLGVPLFMAGGGAIYAVFTPLAIHISETWGFPFLALLMIPGMFVGIVLLLQYRQKRVEHPSVVIRPRSRRETINRAGAVSFWPLLGIGLCFCASNGLLLSLLSSHFELTFGPEARDMAGWTLMALGIGGSLASFFWSWLARRYNFYGLCFIAMLVAVPMFILLGHPGTPLRGLLLGAIISVVTPAALHPVGVLLSRNAAGSTQAMRTSLMIGFNYGMSSVAIMIAGMLLRMGVASSWLMVMVGGFAAVAGGIAAWQYIKTTRAGIKVHT